MTIDLSPYSAEGVQGVDNVKFITDFGDGITAFKATLFREDHPYGFIGQFVHVAGEQWFILIDHSDFGFVRHTSPYRNELNENCAATLSLTPLNEEFFGNTIPLHGGMTDAELSDMLEVELENALEDFLMQ